MIRVAYTRVGTKVHASRRRPGGELWQRTLCGYLGKAPRQMQERVTCRHCRVELAQELKRLEREQRRVELLLGVEVEA